MSGSMLRFAAHPVHAYSTGLPCSTNWFSLFPPENSLFDQINSLFRGVGNSKLKPHDISGLGGFDPAYSRPNPRNSLYFPCKTGKSGQRRVRSRLRHRLSSPFQWSVFSTSKTVDAALYDLHPATEPTGLGWTGGQACLNPSRFRWASHLNGRRVFFMSVFAVSPGGCRPSMMAVTMSGAR